VDRREAGWGSPRSSHALAKGSSCYMRGTEYQLYIRLDEYDDCPVRLSRPKMGRLGAAVES